MTILIFVCRFSDTVAITGNLILSKDFKRPGQHWCGLGLTSKCSQLSESQITPKLRKGGRIILPLLYSPSPHRLKCEAHRIACFIQTIAALSQFCIELNRIKSALQWSISLFYQSPQSPWVDEWGRLAVLNLCFVLMSCPWDSATGIAMGWNTHCISLSY